MNDNLKNLTMDPDPQVWDKIERTMRRRAIAKYSAMAVAVASLVGVGVLLWPKHEVVSVAQTPAATVELAAADEAVVMAETPQQAKLEEVAPSNIITFSVEYEDQFDADAVPFGEPYVERNIAAATAKVAPQAAAPVKKIAAEAAGKPVVEAKAAKNSTDTSIAISHEPILGVPNIFAPDGDVAENRVFKVVPNANEPVSEYRIYIYDRAGRCVFESNNITEGWNGTYKGQKLPQAAYVYVLSCKKSDGSPYMTKGSVVLVR